MFAKILGIIWIFLGILWSLKPAILKNRLQRKMSRKIRWIVIGFILVFGLLLFGSVLKSQGILPKIIGIIAIVITIKGILLITSKASEKMFDWWAGRPLLFFRIWGLFVLATGLMLIFVR